MLTQLPQLTPTSTALCLHRIHEGSPAKIHTPERIFHMASREGTVVWKARRVTQQEDLEPGEVFITHRRVIDDVDCSLGLAKIGVSEAVLVSEGLAVLAEDADEIFQCLSGMGEYRNDTQTIMASIKDVQGLQGKGSFCRFAYALYNGCQQDGQLYNAIQRSGMKLFWSVLADLATENPENNALNWMISLEEEEEFIAISAWNQMFCLLEVMHQKSHLFSFIGGNLGLAEAAFEVLKFLASETKQEKYKEVSYLIRSAIPVIEKKISQKKINALKEELQNKTKADVIRKRLPRRKLWDKV
ncbi:hypothetical protein GOP47_0004489 [Adiantum capillus-veneris]|uniref:Uncharacterized protein n=1 Tax=Adiantum capillus-veneris TaxID=13818 RepID=A0A9D4V8S2_ADICA|nr:hypothetical protein GOP47_0004489 [Adiantum capillus-veneris]